MDSTTASDKICIVTGASSGIGQATAIALARLGSPVVLAARRSDRIDRIATQITADGGRAIAVTCDVRSRADVQNVVNQTMDAFGRIDVLINNAGVMPLAPMAQCRMDDWDAMVDVNVKGLLYGIGLVLPIMLEQQAGHIINISSVAGRKVLSGGAVYCATKHAVHAVSEGLRQELGEMHNDSGGNRIRVSIISPGVVTTELPDSITDDQTRQWAQNYYNTLEGPLTSEDIAEAIVYCVAAPPHVNVNEILIRPTAQVR